MHNPIKHWSEHDQPREKLRNKGVEALSDAELLAILIHNGTRNASALDLAKEILQLGKYNLTTLGRLSLAQLKKVKGIGEAKGITIIAALELGKRRHAGPVPEKLQIRQSSDMVQYLQTSFQDLSYEIFGVAFLNRANRVKCFEIISRGGITGTIADPRLIMKRALEEEAVHLILCHNHPSGNLRPSKADELLTQKIKEAGNLLDIQVIDHIIVSEQGYFSFADDGRL